MGNSYKDAYNEFAGGYFDEFGSSPTLEQSETFTDSWVSSQYERAEEAKESERENSERDDAIKQKSSRK